MVEILCAEMEGGLAEYNVRDVGISYGSRLTFVDTEAGAGTAKTEEGEMDALMELGRIELEGADVGGECLP